MRKARVWAPNPEAVWQLGRGAKRMASKSAAVMATPSVKTGMTRLRKLLRAERLCKLRQGDVLVQLIDHHLLRPIDIARRTKQRPNDLSQMYLTCRLFPPRVRRRDVPYNAYFMAMRMVRKFKHLNLAPMDVLAEIQRLGFTQHRDVTAHFSAKARQADNDRAVRLAELATPDQPFNRAYLARFQTLLNVFPDESINHDNSPRGDIIRFAPVSVPHLAGTQQHAFEKPVALCKYLIAKHTHERELVFDACGCTASMSVAAMETNREWVYAESNSANYGIGTARIAGTNGSLSACAG